MTEPGPIGRYFRRPAFWRRLAARRGPAAFLDTVSGAPVWTWRLSDGRTYVGRSRFGVWVRRIPRPEPAPRFIRLQHEETGRTVEAWPASRPIPPRWFEIP